MKKCFVRLLSVLLTVALALSLAGCSSSNTEVTAKGYPADENTTWGELFEHFDKEGFDTLPAEIQEQLKADLLSDDIWEKDDIQAGTPVNSENTTEEEKKKVDENISKLKKKSADISGQIESLENEKIVTAFRSSGFSIEDVITTISMMKSDDSKEQNVVPIKEEVKAQ